MAKRFGVELQISRLMLLIGLMCERLRRFEEGERIFRAMKAYRDDLPHPSTFLALCYVSQGRLPEALRELEAVRAAHPEYQMSKVLLGIAHRDAGKAGWQQLLQEVIDDGHDEYAIKLAQDALGLDTAVQSASSSADGLSDVPRTQRVYA
jgi:tetratricopeptide (TPR) repeat protein